MGGQLEKLTTVEYQVNDKNNRILSHIATELIQKGNIQGLKKLIQKDVKIIFKDGTTLLHLAALYHQLECLNYLLDKWIIPVNSEDNSCETALNSSLVDPDSFDCAERLIAAGVNINLKNKWLRTPLLKSVIDQNELAVLYLLDKGANPNTEDCMGCTPLNQSAYYHLHRSFNKLLKTSADVDYINRNGQTALIFACKSMNKLAVTKLIKNGAAVNVSLLKKIMINFSHETTKYPEKKTKIESLLRQLVSALGSTIPLDSFLKSAFLQTNLDISHHFLMLTDTRSLFLYKLEHLEFYFKDKMSLLKRCSHVPSLKNMVRLIVRENLVLSGGNVLSQISHLNIPPGLKTVILLEDVC